ncbi:MAG TPA: VOC family protein [Streptosporangiaceae bacterium]|nr:VOC family protein [Streptosporangiaceae bacterium]
MGIVVGDGRPARELGGAAAAEIRYSSAIAADVASAAARTVLDMAIARYPSIVIDCPDPAALARFYGAMLDWKTDISPGWGEIRAEYGQCITFQQVEDYTPPRWPGQQVPQQMHLDVIVDDLDAAEAAVLDLGATKHEHQPGTSFRVFLDPAGHPFCLCVD